MGADRGAGTVELNARSIQSRRQNVLKIPKKGGLAFKISPKEFRKQAKELNINVRGFTDEEIRRKVQNKKSLLAVQKKFSEDTQYRESKRARTKLAQEKFKTNTEKYRKYLESVQESRIASGRFVKIPKEFSPQGIFWADIVKTADENRKGRLQNSHIKYAAPNIKTPKTIDAVKKIKLVDINVIDPKTNKPKIITYDNFLKHLEDNKNLYRIDSKTALREYEKKNFFDSNTPLKKKFIKKFYDIDISDKALYESGGLKKGIAPYKRAPFHMHHTAGRGENVFNVQYALGTDNIEEGRLRKVFDSDFKYGKNLSEKKEAVKKFINTKDPFIESRRGGGPYGTRETLRAVTERTAPELLQDLIKTVNKSPQVCRKILDYKTGGISTTCATAIAQDPIKAATALEEIKPTSAALGKVRNAASAFLKFAGKGKVFGITAGVGAGAGALVKQFRNDEPDTYLSNENQMKAMLVDTFEEDTLGKAGIGGELAAAGLAVPGSAAVYKARRLPFTDATGKTRAAMGPLRAGLGPVGKALSGFATPLGMALTTPINIARQIREGDSLEDIATNPFNYLAPALAGRFTREATRGMNPQGILARGLRLGMNPATIRAGSKFLGLPGLALSLGYEGYDQYKKYKEGEGFIYNLLNKDE